MFAKLINIHTIHVVHRHRNSFSLIVIAFLTLVLNGCSSTPNYIKPVTGFDANRYLGKWYEIARLDNYFERGLSNITAEYSLRKDGKIAVLNSGYNTKKKKWQSAEGRAKFVESRDVGQLEVSFFGPFYGGYNIIELDKENYQHVMIVGNDRKYLWILSRKPTLAPEIKQRLISKAAELKFPVDKLIYVDHKPVEVEKGSD